MNYVRSTSPKVIVEVHLIVIIFSVEHSNKKAVLFFLYTDENFMKMVGLLILKLQEKNIPDIILIVLPYLIFIDTQIFINLACMIL